MSRIAQSKSSPVARRDGRSNNNDLNPQDEICPVCKSTKYMNPSLRFLVNPACYHKMCESCVDRLFSHGPGPCPIKGCSETLRKNRFRQQTFEDIQVEREVDIRKNVARVFNRREDEFESLRDYNDYLNDVEDITFNLIHGIDFDETQRRFNEYEQAHKDEIKENATLAQQEQLRYVEIQKAEREQMRKRREEARREEAEEKKEAEANRKDMLRRLENGQDPEAVRKAGAEVQLKKRLNRQQAAEKQQALQAADTRNGSSSIVIKGLKNRKAKTEPEAPVDPFGGLHFETKYYALQNDYVWDGLKDAIKDVKVCAGGYDVATFTGRALCEAFSGLGVMVADEAAERDRMQDSEGKSAAEDVKMEDPF